MILRVNMQSKCIGCKHLKSLMDFDFVNCKYDDIDDCENWIPAKDFFN